ncbi:MAG: hypothetical protein ACOYYU_01375 [Chloroflexota bacterium]
MKNRIIFTFLLITLAACTPVVEPAETPAQPTLSTMLVAVTTADALTQAARFPSPPPTDVIVTPSPLPTQPVYPVITPDAAQVARWREYEDALAKSLFSSQTPESYFCEWDILGQSDQEIYMWVICDIPGGGRGASAPAIIFLNSDESIGTVKILGKSSDYSADILMLPTDVQQKLDSYRFREKILWEHLEWRQTHPEEPPLIVLSAATTTPIP